MISRHAELFAPLPNRQPANRWESASLDDEAFLDTMTPVGLVLTGEDGPVTTIAEYIEQIFTTIPRPLCQRLKVKLMFPGV